jgi:hypothetical protein
MMPKFDGHAGGKFLARSGRRAERLRRGTCAWLAGAALAAVFGTLCTATHAETRVQGTRDAVVIETRTATVQEILEALHDRFGVGFSIPRDAGVLVTGRYEGRLNDVIVRMLDRHQVSYIVEHSGDSIGITVLGVGEPAITTGVGKPRSAENKSGFRRAPEERKKARSIPPD